MLYVMSWNIGFGSRKEAFKDREAERTKLIVSYLRTIQEKLPINAIAFQEMANRILGQVNTRPKHFDLVDFMRTNGLQTFFVPTLSLGKGGRNAFPYQKVEKLANLCVIGQEQGLGLVLPESDQWRNDWKLEHFYLGEEPGEEALKACTDKGIEISRPIGHPLYMVPDRNSSAGRDEEDRLVVWARIGNSYTKAQGVVAYIVSLHLPTLVQEEQGSLPIKSASQIRIAEDVLRLRLQSASADRSIYANLEGEVIDSVDHLGAELRMYALRQIVSQTARLESYWKNRPEPRQCVFILAGDYNFLHLPHGTTQTKEQQFLQTYGFQCAKKKGTTRPRWKKTPNGRVKIGNRLVDNIWVKGARDLTYCPLPFDDDENENQPQTITLRKISDHYPVVAAIALPHKAH